jgi:hypothetical protein
MLLGGMLQAQTAAEMDAILDSRSISCGQVARFVLQAVDIFAPEGRAFEYARENAWLSPKTAEDAPIKLGELARLIMGAFELKGSFLYRLFPGPRYALRELVYRQHISGAADPSRPVSGEDFLQILESVLNAAGRAEVGGLK